MISIEDYDLIDKYLRHELTKEEILTLQVRKKSDDFSKLLREMEAISETISEVGAKQFKNEMEQWYQEDTPIHRSKTKKFVWISIAASLLLLCSLIVWNYSSSKSERLSHSFATHFPDYISQVNRGALLDDQIYAPLMLPYQNSNWVEALSGFETYLSSHPDDFKIELYRGISLYQNKEYKKAITSLQHVLNKTNDITFSEPARWYLILSYIADGQKEKGSRLLADLTNNHQHFEYDKAIELLNILAK